MRLRGFEIAKGWEDKDIHIPVRKTKGSAAYDVELRTAGADWRRSSNRRINAPFGDTFMSALGIGRSMKPPSGITRCRHSVDISMQP